MTSEFHIIHSFIQSFNKFWWDFCYAPAIFLSVGELNKRDVEQNILEKSKFLCRLK